MKVFCDRCHKDITSDVVASFSNYYLGYVKCNNCQKENQRYICESDAWVYYIFSSFIYYFALIIIVLSMSFTNFIITIVSVAISMIILYKILIYGILYIYNNGPFNGARKNYDFKQNDKTLKLAKSQNIIYILLIFMIGANSSTLFVSVGIFLIMIMFGLYKFFQVRKQENIMYNHKL